MFALASTLLTVVLAVCRYIVVCRPLHARVYIRLPRIRCSIVAAFLASAVINVPRLLRYTVTARHCSELGLVSANFTGHCECFFYSKVRHVDIIASTEQAHYQMREQNRILLCISKILATFVGIL